MAQRLAGLQSRRFVECCGSTSNLGSTAGVPAAERTGRIWPAPAAPGIIWLLLCSSSRSTWCCHSLRTGRPAVRTPIPVWNPLQWDPHPVQLRAHPHRRPRRYLRAGIVAHRGLRRGGQLPLPLIAFPVAYYVARLSGKRKGLLLALLIAPFWISYNMRMFAWVNLLQDDGLVNRVLGLGGLFTVNVNWLTGPSVVVILGLVYGYVPYTILPLYAGLDRLSQPMLEASRDLGADRFSSFWRVTLPLCRPTIVAAVLLTCLPMLGDFFTSDRCSRPRRRPRWSATSSTTACHAGQTGQAGAFVMLVFLVALLPMLYYIRVRRGATRCRHEKPGRVVERSVATAVGSGRDHRWVPDVVTAAGAHRGDVSFNAGRSRTVWQGFSFRWYWGDQLLSVWHDATLHNALLQTLKLGVIATAITVPGRTVRDRHRPVARPPAGRTSSC